MYATLSLLPSSIFHVILTTTPAEIKSRKDSPSLKASLTANHAASSGSGHLHVMSHNPGVLVGQDVLECGEVLQMDWENGAGGLLVSGACFQVTKSYYHFSS